MTGKEIVSKTRRTALLGMGAFALGGRASLAASDDPIVLTMYGGASERAFRAALLEPFEKATGIKVIPKLGSPSEWLTSAIVNKRKPEIDILWLGFPESVRAVAEDVVQPLSEERIPNMKSVRPRLKDLYDGKGVGHEFVSFGIAYRTDLVKAPPKSWADLFSPSFANQIALPDIVSPGGWELLMMGAKLNGGSESNLDPGLAAVEKIRGGVKRFYKNQTEAANLLDTGEAPIVGVISDFRAYAMQDAGKPIGFVRPAEGAIPSLVSFHIAKNTAHTEKCEKFIDFALSVQGQTAFCNELVCGTARPDIALKPTAAQRVTPFESLIIFDWRKVLPNTRRYVETWNRTIAR
ncbi:ABC transporter substrate-binding protein [Variovorax sp. LjRoot290]|uniref:ABC transporter substrate-binding protein n=1 Tax=unclassified Variovorax TaxID=663243 RepID=UPI003ED0AED5